MQNKELGLYLGLYVLCVKKGKDTYKELQLLNKELTPLLRHRKDPTNTMEETFLDTLILNFAAVGA